MVKKKKAASKKPVKQTLASFIRETVKADTGITNDELRVKIKKWQPRRILPKTFPTFVYKVKMAALEKGFFKKFPKARNSWGSKKAKVSAVKQTSKKRTAKKKKKKKKAKAS